MILIADRRSLAKDIQIARDAGARLKQVCDLAGIGARIVPMLADEGMHLSSESAFGRVLRAHGQTARRARAKAPRAKGPPTTHIATAARQDLVRGTALPEGIAALADKPALHGDNGSTLKATTVLAMLEWLGVKPSYSRPRVSDDNAYAKALFRTAKYRPDFPTKGFATLEAAQQWGLHLCTGAT
jgi:putative transposase